MRQIYSGKRFGIIAIKKGFITKDQFIEAMAVQVDIFMDGGIYKRIGEILLEMGNITKMQLNYVLEEM